MPDNEDYTEDLSVGGELRLGKREPVNKATLEFGEFFTAERPIPAHPLVSPPPAVPWTMDRNDQAGDCVVAGVNHTLQAIAQNLGIPRTPWNDTELLELYRTQNPDFHSWDDGGSAADQGMIIQTFLEECVRREHILAFARIDHTNHELVEAAAYIGGGVVTGELLRVDHSNLSKPWDYSKSRIWGGHCTTTVGYGEALLSCITWGQTVSYTQAFAERHMDEAWFVLTQGLVNSPGFRNNFDLPGFASAIADLTGGKVVVPVPDVPPLGPPAPPPGSNDPPLPSDPAWVDFPFTELNEWERRGAKHDPGYERKARNAYTRWKQAHNVDTRTAATKRVVYDADGNKVGEVDLGTNSFHASQG